MILLKGFFRKKTTIIYLSLFSILLTTIIILFSLIKYYSDLDNTYFKSNSYIIIVSKNNYDNILAQNGKVSSFERALIFNPDNAYNILNEVNSDGKDTIEWKDLVIGYPGVEDGIFVFPNTVLKIDEVSLGIAQDKLYQQDYDEKLSILNNKYVSKHIGFYNENEKLDFTIKNVYETVFSEIEISNETFEKLINNSSLFIYRVIAKDYIKAILLVDELEEMESNNDNIISLNQKYAYNENKLDTVKLNEIINFLRLVSAIIICIFSIIFIIIIKNIIRDENQNIRIERLLGYSKRKVKHVLFLKFTSLNIISFAITTIIFLLTMVLINYALKFNLKIIINDTLLVYCLILMITTLICYSTRIKI